MSVKLGVEFMVFVFENFVCFVNKSLCRIMDIFISLRKVKMLKGSVSLFVFYISLLY